MDTMDTVKDFLISVVMVHGVKIFWISALLVFGKLILRIVVRRIARGARSVSKDDKDLSKRIATLESVLITVGNITIYVIVLMSALDLFGLNIAPILAGAGVIGLAVGFGSQALVKDVVSGLFILIEGRYEIGDTVIIGSTEGVVKSVTLRSTVIRDKEGNLQTLPFNTKFRQLFLEILNGPNSRPPNLHLLPATSP